MKTFMKSAVFTGAFLSTLSLAQAPENDSPGQEDPDPTLPTICTTEASLICVSSETLGFQSVALGRLGPNCEFPTLPNTVDNENCVGSTPPTTPTICTVEAKILCLEDSEDGSFSTIEVGRVGPNCDFPEFASEVDLSFCSDTESK